MSGPDKNPASPPAGGRAAERLREFLRERLPSGISPEKLNPAAEKNYDKESSSPDEEDKRDDRINPDKKS